MARFSQDDEQTLEYKPGASLESLKYFGYLVETLHRVCVSLFEVIDTGSTGSRGRDATLTRQIAQSRRLAKVFGRYYTIHIINGTAGKICSRASGDSMTPPRPHDTPPATQAQSGRPVLPGCEGTTPTATCVCARARVCE
jgi:hypothetical protein